MTDALADQMNETAIRYKIGFQHGGRSMMAGFAAVSDGAVAIVKDAVRNRSPVIQSLAGLGMAATRLFGALPFGIADWVEKSVEEAPHGPAAVLTKAIELTALGVMAGVGHVVGELRDATRGEWSGKTTFETAYSTTLVMGEGAFLAWGAKAIVSGGTKMGGSFGAGLKSLNAPFPAVAVAYLTVDSMALSRGAMEIGMGTMMVDGNAAVNGGQSKGVPRPNRQKVSDADSVAAQKNEVGVDHSIKTDRGESRSPPTINMPDPNLLTADAHLADTLGHYRGNRTKAALFLRTNLVTIARRIDAALPGSPLYEFKNK